MVRRGQAVRRLDPAALWSSINGNHLYCTAPAELTARRMSSRTGSASGAGPVVAEKMAAVQAPWPEAITIDMRGAKPPGPVTVSAEPVRQALEAIRPHQPERLWRPSRPYMLPD